MKPFSFIARSALAALVSAALLVSVAMFAIAPLDISTLAYQTSLSSIAIAVVAIHFVLNDFHLDLSPGNSTLTLIKLASDFGLSVLAFLCFMLATHIAGVDLWQVGVGAAMLTAIGIAVASVLVKHTLATYDPLRDLDRSIVSHSH